MTPQGIKNMRSFTYRSKKFKCPYCGQYCKNGHTYSCKIRLDRGPGPSLQKLAQFGGSEVSIFAVPYREYMGSYTFDKDILKNVSKRIVERFIKRHWKNFVITLSFPTMEFQIKEIVLMTKNCY